MIFRIQYTQFVDIIANDEEEAQQKFDELGLDLSVESGRNIYAFGFLHQDEEKASGA